MKKKKYWTGGLLVFSHSSYQGSPTPGPFGTERRTKSTRRDASRTQLRSWLDFICQIVTVHWLWGWELQSPSDKTLEGLICVLSLSFFLREGVTVPMGPGVKTGVGKHKSYTLLYNEFVIYNPAQIQMRYLLRIKFNYSSLWWGREKE